MTTDLKKIIKLLPGYDPYRDAEGYYFDEQLAADAVDFFPTYLTHIEGQLANQPYVLEPHEQAIVANIFGWKSEDDNTRRYREALYYVPKKNSKTTLSAGICLMFLFFDGEMGAQCYTCAGDDKQANIMMRIAKGMVDNSPDLSAISGEYQRSITYPETRSFFERLTSKTKTKHGFNVHFGNVDEVHIVERDLITTLRYGVVARLQPFFFYTTTADYERDSACNDLHKYAHQVMKEPGFDPSFLPIIFEASKDDDWHDIKVWYKANPLLGKSIILKNFKTLYNQARNNPLMENEFKRLHLNIRTSQKDRWLDMDNWYLCTDSKNPIHWRKKMIEKMKGRKCFAGLDFGQVSDLSSLVLVFHEDGEYIVIPYFWIPQDGLASRDPKNRIKYEKWIEQGFMMTTEGNATDYRQIREFISGYDGEGNRKENCLMNQFDIQEIAIDRFLAGGETGQNLQDDGLDVFAFGQGFRSMTAPTIRCDELVTEGKLNHGNNPILSWMAENAEALRGENDAIKIVKPKEQWLKVDGVLAMLMGLGREIESDKTDYTGYGVLH